MENASRALIMAGSVLLGVLLLSIAVYLFSTYADYSSEAYQRMEATQIEQFNAQFLKYYGTIASTYEDEKGKMQEKVSPILCTAHDIVSLANLARTSNINNEIENEAKYSDKTLYIQIDVDVKVNNVTTKIRNIEKYNEDQKLQFIQNYSTHDVRLKDEFGSYIIENGTYKTEKQAINFVCTEAKVSDSTKRIQYMHFKEQ